MNPTFDHQERVRKRIRDEGFSPTVNMDLTQQSVNTNMLYSKMEELRKLKQNKKKCDSILQYFSNVSRVVNLYDETKDQNGDIAKNKLKTLKTQMNMINKISGGKKKRKSLFKKSLFKKKRTKRRRVSGKPSSTRKNKYVLTYIRSLTRGRRKYN